MLDLDNLLGELHTDKRFADLKQDDLVLLETGGVAHDHIAVRGVEIDGKTVLIRAPRLSQWGLPAQENLGYQAAAFERLMVSGQTPEMFSVLAVSERLPMGALIVERIVGVKPRLPDDMAAIARCLARIHCLPMPPEDRRAPLRVHRNPAVETLKVIQEQAAHMPKARLARAARRQIEEDLDWARRFAAETEDGAQAIALVGTDTHPGNFLITEDRQAVFVDLEKALYGAPAIDLAHASLYTSTKWDPDSAAALDEAGVRSFYRVYFDAAGPECADRLRPWARPMRRLTWLRTLTWCIRWRVLSRRPDEAWSATRLPPGLEAHIARTVEDYVNPQTIAAIRSEWL